MIIVSDLHINSTIGLLAPSVRLADGQHISQSPAQAWSWQKYQDFLAQPKKGRIVTVFNGEIADKNYHPTTQIITEDVPSIIDMSLATIEPLVSISDKVIVTRGTEAHAGIGGYIDELIAREIRAERLGGSDHAHMWAEFMVENVRFDIAHHPRFGGGSYHTSHNTAGKLAADMVMYCAKYNRPLPDILIRSHNHSFSDSGLNYPVRALVTPPWQLSTHFSHRLGYGGKLMPIGGVHVYVSGGKYHIAPSLYMPDDSGEVQAV